MGKPKRCCRHRRHFKCQHLPAFFERHLSQADFYIELRMSTPSPFQANNLQDLLTRLTSSQLGELPTPHKGGLR